MEFNKQLLLMELERLERECRLQSKGQRPALALMRLSNSLNSLIVSLNEGVNATGPLTSRESEVLQAVSQGFTNREIASALFISEKTVEFHLKSIFLKADATTRTEAVKNALKDGWLR